MRQVGLLGMFWAIILSVGCGQHPSSTSTTQAILGDDSLSPVGSPLAFPGLPLQAIGRMQGGCTAFHLGEGLVATAGHCLPTPSGNVTDMPCASFTIAWHEGPQSSRCLRYLSYRLDAEADFALIEVFPHPAARLEVVSPGFSPEIEAATVVGFPKDRELSASGACRLELSSTNTFYHSCDTLPGNSGSPLIDLASGQVVGIHNGEADTDNKNYGTFVSALGDIEKIRASLTSGPKWPAQMSFGPFGDREEKLLLSLGQQLGEKVSFQLAVDLEEGCDQLVVTDGRGVRRVFTGRSQQDLELPTPVSLVLNTDYSGASQSVELSALHAAPIGS